VDDIECFATDELIEDEQLLKTASSKRITMAWRVIMVKPKVRTEKAKYHY